MVNEFRVRLIVDPER